MTVAATAGLPVMENEGTIAAARSIVEPIGNGGWAVGGAVFQIENVRQLPNAPWSSEPGGE